MAVATEPIGRDGYDREEAHGEFRCRRVPIEDVSMMFTDDRLPPMPGFFWIIGKGTGWLPLGMSNMVEFNRPELLNETLGTMLREQGLAWEIVERATPQALFDWARGNAPYTIEIVDGEAVLHKREEGDTE